MNQTKSSVLTRLPVLVACALLCNALWGSAIPGVKTGYQLFGIDTGHTPSMLLFAGIRFTLAGLMVLVAGSLIEKRPLIPRGGFEWRSIAIVGLFQTVIQYALYYTALPRIAGVTASIFISTNTFFALLLSTFVFRMEKLAANKVIGCLIGFVGVLLVQVTPGGALTFSPTAEGFILCSTFCAALSAVLSGKFGQRMSSMALSGWQFFLGGLVLTLMGALGGGRFTQVTPGALVLLGYLSLVSALGYTLWSCLFRDNPISRVAVFGFSQPIFGVLFSALILTGERDALNWRVLCALVLVSAGIYILNRGKKAPKS